MKLLHIILAPGKGIKCPCGEPAAYFRVCHQCRAVVASCGGHGKTIARTAEEHCR